MTRCPRSLLRWLSMLLVAGRFAAVPAGPAVAQDGATPADVGAPPSVDLARVSVRPSDMPAPGFQVDYAGSLDYSGFVDEVVSSVPGANSSKLLKAFDGDDFRVGYLSTLALPNDPANPDSVSLTFLDTLIAETVSEDSAIDLAEALGARLGMSEVVQDGNHVVWMRYQSGFDVLPSDAEAELRRLTTQRLRDAVAMAERGDPALGLGNIVFRGASAQETSDQVYSPQDESYRILDGKGVPSRGM